MLGNYDVVAGIGFGLIDASLSGLYASYAIPNSIPFSSILNPVEQQGLLQKLKTDLTGIPQGAAPASFQLSSTPTVKEVPTTPYVMVTVPFTLDFEAGNPVTNTATLSGHLYFAAVCGALSPEGALVFTISAPNSQHPPSDLPASSIRVNAGSQVQPASDEAATAVATLLGKILAPVILESVAIGPVISVPKFSGSAGQSIVDVRTSTVNSGHVGPAPAIFAGVQFPGESRPATDPAALLDLERSLTANLYVWLNSSTVHTNLYKAKLNATQGKAIVSQAPIHQTELVPAVSQLNISDTGDEFSATVFIELNPDLVSRFVYARFLGSVSGRYGAKPLQAANVQLCDLDVPAPLHDDTVIPKSGTTSHTNGKFVETTTTTFEPPTSNQILGRSKTNLDGRVIFAFSPGDGSFAGQVLVETLFREPGGPPVENSRRYDVTENFPDLFFTVDGSDVSGDTLKSPNGLFINYNGQRLGSPATPVTYIFTYQQESVLNLA